MTMSRFVKRGVGVLLLVAAAAVSLAPVAQAGHGHGRVRYKGPGRVVYGPGVVRVVDRRPVFIERHSDLGPAIAGFFGGLVLGSVLSNAQPAPPPPPVYDYYDPYCRERFPSLDLYDQHLDWHSHPRVIEVIEIHSGRCVDTYDWRDGRWSSRQVDPDWEDEGPGRDN
jgi:hypothetical protein